MDITNTIYFIFRMDKDGSLNIDYDEWRDYLLLAPSSDLHELVKYWRHSTVSINLYLVFWRGIVAIFRRNPFKRQKYSLNFRSLLSLFRFSYSQTNQKTNRSKLKPRNPLCL